MLSEKTVWTIVKSILALVLLAIVYYICQGGIQGAEILGLILFCAGLAWMVGLGEKYYPVEGKGTMYNHAITAALCVGGALLIWLV